MAAVVSRGERPDRAAEFLLQVKARTLLIVGGNVSAVLEWNATVNERSRLVEVVRIVEAATHLFAPLANESLRVSAIEHESLRPKRGSRTSIAYDRIDLDADA